MSAGPSLKTRALGYLARREHSRLELEKKLTPYAQTPAELSSVLDMLEQSDFLSARRLVEQLVHVRRSKFGSQRILHELQEKGIAEDLIAAALPDLKETELDTACAVWRKKFGAVPGNAKERGKQMRFLLSRGFAPDVIYKVLLHSDTDEA